MQSHSGTIHECHGGLKCSVHVLAGRGVIPCSGGAPAFWIPTQEYGQSLSDLVLAFERYLISDALKRNGGKIKETAQCLGLTRQAVEYIVNGRLKDLKELVVPQPHGRPGSRRGVVSPVAQNG